MTMPHLMNCEHQGNGRCAECEARFAPASVMPPRNLSKCDGGKAHRWKTFPSGIVRCVHCEMDGKEHARLAYLYQLEKARWARRHNSEIRQAGPETHDKQKQRNPALPASNG